jgi:hypothetical protein
MRGLALLSDSLVKGVQAEGAQAEGIQAEPLNPFSLNPLLSPSPPSVSRFRFQLTRRRGAIGMLVQELGA